jgi:hypothetical protein
MLDEEARRAFSIRASRRIDQVVWEHFNPGVPFCGGTMLIDEHHTFISRSEIPDHDFTQYDRINILLLDMTDKEMVLWPCITLHISKLDYPRHMRPE